MLITWLLVLEHPRGRSMWRLIPLYVNMCRYFLLRNGYLLCFYTWKRLNGILGKNIYNRCPLKTVYWCDFSLLCILCCSFTHPPTTFCWNPPNSFWGLYSNNQPTNQPENRLAKDQNIASLLKVKEAISGGVQLMSPCMDKNIKWFLKGPIAIVFFSNILLNVNTLPKALLNFVFTWMEYIYIAAFSQRVRRLSQTQTHTHNTEVSESQTKYILQTA